MQMLLHDFLTDNIPLVLILLIMSFLSLFIAAVISGTIRSSISKQERIALFVLFVVSFLLRGYFIPVIERHIYDGHEADYFDVMRGVKPPPSDDLFMYYPAVTYLYRALGVITGGGEYLLPFFNILLSSVSIVFIYLIVRRMSRGSSIAGLFGAALYTIHPYHIFWSSSAYNVMIPFFLQTAIILLIAHSIERRSPLLISSAILLTSIAILTRLESLFLLPAIVIVTLFRTFPLVKKMPSSLFLIFVSLFSIYVSLTLLGVFSGSRATSDTADYLIDMANINITFLNFYTPYHTPFFLILSLSGVVIIIFRKRELLFNLLVLFIIFISFAIPYLFFDDFEYRHTLLPCLFFAFLSSITFSEIVKIRSYLRLPSIVLIILFSIITIFPSLVDVRKRYYAPQGTFDREVWEKSSGRSVEKEEMVDCLLVTEYHGFRDLAQVSHFNLLRPEEFKSLKHRFGCILFIYDLDNYRLSSRSISPRAEKIFKLYSPEFYGKYEDRETGYRALIYSIR